MFPRLHQTYARMAFHSAAQYRVCASHRERIELLEPGLMPINNPLHGVTLEMMVSQLVARHGWAELGRLINVRCFNSDPSIKSSLTFLRRTPWARKKVEDLYLRG